MTRQRVLAAIAAFAMAIAVAAPVAAAAAAPKKFKATRAIRRRQADRRAFACRPQKKSTRWSPPSRALGQRPDEGLVQQPRSRAARSAWISPAASAACSSRVPARTAPGKRSACSPSKKARPSSASSRRSSDERVVHHQATSRRRSGILALAAGEPRRRRRPGRRRPGAVRHRQHQRGRRRLQRSDAGRAGRRQHRHDPRGAAADRVQSRREPSGARVSTAPCRSASGRSSRRSATNVLGSAGPIQVFRDFTERAADRDLVSRRAGQQARRRGSVARLPTTSTRISAPTSISILAWTATTGR